MNSMTQVANGAWIALAWLAGPPLAVAFGIGVVVAITQAVTQIQESSLSFAPKLIGLIALLALLGASMFEGVTRYATALYTALPVLIAHG